MKRKMYIFFLSHLNVPFVFQFICTIINFYFNVFFFLLCHKKFYLIAILVIYKYIFFNIILWAKKTYFNFYLQSDMIKMSLQQNTNKKLKPNDLSFETFRRTNLPWKISRFKRMPLLNSNTEIKKIASSISNNSNVEDSYVLLLLFFL